MSPTKTVLPGTTLFVDGDCVVCDHAAQYLMAHDDNHQLYYSILQGPTAADLRAQGVQLPDDINTVVVVEPDGTVHTRTTAILRTLTVIGHRPLWARLLGVVPRPVRDLGYRAFAASRYRLFGTKEVCSVPTTEERRLMLP